MHFSPAWWLRGPHAQTIWGKLFRRQIPQSTRIERLETADGDFVELHRIKCPSPKARLLLLHGLEGTRRSHYAQALLAEAARRQWSADLMLFRSCGSELNRTRRLYHSGETADLAMVLANVVGESPGLPVVLAGVSLGGNVLLKFLGERGTDLPPEVTAAAAVSVPFDLARSARRIEQGFSRLYQRFFIRSLSRKARAKLEQFPDLIQAMQLSDIRTMYDFDNAITAPLHGFHDADDYYARSSSLGWLSRIRLNTLLLSATDDPFLPGGVLDQVHSIARHNPSLQLEFSEHGGHVGFVTGANPFRPVYYLEHRIGEFLAERLSARQDLEHSHQET